MPFSEDIKIKALVSCGRKCCVCHKFCGNNVQEKQMGMIPVCSETVNKA